MARYLVIVNPVAGSGAGERSIPRIEHLLVAHALNFDLVHTARPGHAIDLAREAAPAGYDVVVAAGGDGTVNEVINGLMAFKLAGGSPPALGVLCVGRGNDFAVIAGVSQDLDHACQVLSDDRRRVIDIGRVVGGRFPEGRYFGNCVGVGFDAIGTIEAAKLPRLGGFLSYLIAVLKTIFLYYRAPVATIVHEGQTITQPSLPISIMNGRRLGGGFHLAPDAEPDDGLFDLCIAHEVSRPRMFALLPHFLRGTQATQPEVATGRASRISITSLGGPLPAQTDGEIMSVDGQHLEVELLPRQLELVCALPEGA